MLNCVGIHETNVSLLADFHLQSVSHFLNKFSYPLQVAGKLQSIPDSFGYKVGYNFNDITLLGVNTDH